MNKFKVLGIIMSTRSRIVTMMVFFLMGLAIMFPDRINLPIFCLVLITYLIYQIIIFSAYVQLNQETRKAIHKLDIKCDPEEFLAIINQMVTYIKRPKSLKRWILINKTAGLYEMGNYDEAINLLEQIKVNELACIYQALYYNNFISCCINKFLFQKKENSLIELAEDKLKELLKIIDEGRINKKYLDILNNAYKYNQTSLDVCKGEYKICIEQLEEYYSKIENIRGKIDCKFKIGYCYYMDNNKLQSKEYFEYIVNNGNKLYVAQEAKKYMEKID